MYKNMSSKEHEKMPKGESLKMVKERIQPYWTEQILPSLKSLMESGEDKQILFVAHEHVLRGMV